MTNVTAADATTPPATTGTTVSRTDNSLGQDDFLQLMMLQLKNQDPLNPSDPTQYLSELANFSTLQQETSIAASSQQSATQQSTAAALGLLGHTVSYTDSSGATQSGAVQKIDFTASGPTLTIGGQPGITLGAISEVS
jgi:flagellar basal-body rod modification protein FlgD